MLTIARNPSYVIVAARHRSANAARKDAAGVVPNLCAFGAIPFRTEYTIDPSCANVATPSRASVWQSSPRHWRRRGHPLCRRGGRRDDSPDLFRDAPATCSSVQHNLGRRHRVDV